MNYSNILELQADLDEVGTITEEDLPCGVASLDSSKTARLEAAAIAAYEQ